MRYKSGIGRVSAFQRSREGNAQTDRRSAGPAPRSAVVHDDGLGCGAGSLEDHRRRDRQGQVHRRDLQDHQRRWPARWWRYSIRTAANPTCDKCTGENKGKPIKGPLILWGLKQDDASRWAAAPCWTKGQDLQSRSRCSGRGLGMSAHRLHLSGAVTVANKPSRPIPRRPGRAPGRLSGVR